MVYKKAWTKIAACMAAAVLLCSGCGVKFSGNDSCLLQMGKSQINMSEAKLVAMTNKGKFENYYVPLAGEAFWQTGLENGETFETYVKENAIWQELLGVTALNAIGKEEGVELTAEEKQTAGQAAEQYYNSLTKEERKYTKATKSSVTSLIEKYVQAEKVIQELIREADFEISDNEMRVMDIQTIFTKDQDKAREVKSKLDAGEDFMALASNYSEDSVHEYSVGRGKLVETLETAVFSLETGQITGILSAEEGFYIIKCVNDYNETQSAANRQERIDSKTYEIWVEEVKKFADSHTLEVNENAWDKFSLAYRENVGNTTLFEVIDQYFPQENS